MASPGPGQHLDAFTGRDVVYCHQCENEWYQDQHGLECPRCHSGATEIVTADSDPRSIFAPEPELFSRAGRHGGRRGPFADSDSDPDEDDIEEHTGISPNGIRYTQRVYRNMPARSPHAGGPRAPANPADGGAVFNRFADMLFNDFRFGEDAPPPPDFFPRRPADDGPQPPRFARTTFRRTNYPGGSASFTITTAPLRRDGAGHEPPDFNTIFGNLMGNITPPMGAGSPGDHGFQITPLQQLVGALFSAHGDGGGVLGDAVMSQEALDRIITNLMEANPQSNAAPPASQAAIDKLERKALDAKMIGSEGKAECTICIDELNVGDEVCILPCKHWFHGECVILWLKEHNTCPICRAPIEDGSSSSSRPSASRSTSSTSAPAAASGSASAAPAPSTPTHRSSRSPLANPWNTLPFDDPWQNAPPIPHNSHPFYSAPASQTSSPRPSAAPRTDSNSSYRRRDRLFRSPPENQGRLDAIRNVAMGGDASSGPGGASSSRSTPPLGGYRRNSLSPPNMESSSSQRRNSEMMMPSTAEQSSSSHHHVHHHHHYEQPYPSRLSSTRSRRNQRSPSPPAVSSGMSSSSHRRSIFFSGEQDRGEGGGGVSSSNTASSRGGGGSSSHGGPFSWLRDRLQGSGSGGNSDGTNNGDGSRRRS